MAKYKCCRGQENIPAGSFIGKYAGELLTRAQAVQREAVSGAQFMFDIDQDSVVDATRTGNKLRFIKNRCMPLAHSIADA